MKIALIGYGKMGQLIETMAIEQGHEVVLVVRSGNRGELEGETLITADVAIEFTNPHAAWDNVSACLRRGVPVVSGSTGWNERLPEAKQLTLDLGGAFLHASNFSIGVNLFFELNRRLAELMRHQPAYKASIREIHHLQKKDIPSGTAITTAEIMAEGLGAAGWSLQEEENKIPIAALREEGVPGTHEVFYTSEIDTIELKHEAHNRRGFAAGALQAAQFLAGRRGVFTMKDVLGF